MKQSDIRDLSSKELEEKLDQTRSELNKLTINHAVSPLENPMLLRKTRRSIARLETEIRRRELEQVNK